MRPVKDWFRGADWITRSFANARWGGGTIDRLFGGRRFAEPARPEGSPSFCPPAVFGCRCNRASMMLRCCSRTDALRWSCSRIVGSCVANPGDKHAIPASLMVAKLGAAVRGPRVAAESVLDSSKCNLAGRRRVVDGGPGDDGSFFTTIFGTFSPRFL